jgi:hypothetical protein
MLILDTSNSKPDPAQTQRVAELDLEGCVKPILQSKIRFRKAGRTSREGIERVWGPPQPGAQILRGYAEIDGMSLAGRATSRVVCLLRQGHLRHDSYWPYTCFDVTRDEISRAFAILRNCSGAGALRIVGGARPSTACDEANRSPTIASNIQPPTRLATQFDSRRKPSGSALHTALPKVQCHGKRILCQFLLGSSWV